MTPRILLVSVFLTFVATCASAFHVQIGLSGYAVDSKGWVGESIELGATAGTIDAQVCAWLDATPSGRFYDYIPFWSSRGNDVAYISFENNGNLRASTTGHDYTPLWGATIFVPAETVVLGTFGYQNAYQDYRWRNCVVTIRGNPYSFVMNDTASALTVNGVSIPPNETVPLLFPVYLVMREIMGVEFHDLDSGTEIQPLNQDPTTVNMCYYRDGRYLLSYTGNIRISDGTSAPTNAPFETLVFGDMVAANEDKVLYAENDMPLRSAIVNVTTNFQLMTWWDFSHSDWGSSPKAKINDEVVCDGHSTSHIIPYTVNGNNIKVNELTGKGYIYFTMSQTPQSGYAGGSCTMRCWDASAGSGTAGYSAATADHKAESSAGTGVARFKVTVNIYAGTWKVEAL